MTLELKKKKKSCPNDFIAKAEFRAIDQAGILKIENVSESPGGLLIQGPHLENH